MIKFGALFPQTEFGSDPLAVRDFAQTAKALGYAHVSAYEHVLGVDPARYPGFEGPYTYQSPFLEPFVLFAFMAGAVSHLEFSTCILVLPQRQTALVAKQAATLDLLTAGRLRLGLGIGWNRAEYENLGQDFTTRGRRIEEQVELLRRLWTEPLVDFDGRWHHLQAAGVNPLPSRRPIPLWFGGHHPSVLRRVAFSGDGWMPNFRTAAAARPSLDQLDRFLDEAGRSRAGVGLEARISFGDGDPAAWAALVRDWEAAGATHLTLNTMGRGFTTPTAHLDALRQFAGAILQPQV